jgi:hypothetical protein
MTLSTAFDLPAFYLLLGTVKEGDFAAAVLITSDVGLGCAELTLATGESGGRMYIAWNMECHVTLVALNFELGIAGLEHLPRPI